MYSYKSVVQIAPICELNWIKFVESRIRLKKKKKDEENLFTNVQHA